MQLRGIEKLLDEEKYNPKENDDSYLLIPWKEGILLFEDACVQMEKMDSTEVKELLTPPDGIKFLVDLPDEAAQDFEKKVAH